MVIFLPAAQEDQVALLAPQVLLAPVKKKKQWETHHKLPLTQIASAVRSNSVSLQCCYMHEGAYVHLFKFVLMCMFIYTCIDPLASSMCMSVCVCMVGVCVLFLSVLVFVHRPSHLFQSHICDLQGGDWYGNIIMQARISSLPSTNLPAHLSPSPHLSLQHLSFSRQARSCNSAQVPFCSGWSI